MSLQRLTLEKAVFQGININCALFIGSNGQFFRACETVGKSHSGITLEIDGFELKEQLKAILSCLDFTHWLLYTGVATWAYSLQ